MPSFTNQAVAADIVSRLKISDPVIREQMQRHLVHSLKLEYGEYPRLPRKLKKKRKKEGKSY